MAAHEELIAGISTSLRHNRYLESCKFLLRAAATKLTSTGSLFHRHVWTLGHFKDDIGFGLINMQFYVFIGEIQGMGWGQEN